MKICIVGPGAIGGALGFKLARAGHDVTLVARGAHLEAIRAHGLTLVDHPAGGQRSTLPLPVTDNAAAIRAAHGVQDVVVLALKAHGIAPMLGKLAPLIGPDTMVVPAINGLPWWYFQGEGGPFDGSRIAALDADGAMLRDLDCRHIVGCVVHVAGEVRAPGEVHHTGGQRFFIGEIDRRLADAHTPRVAALAAALNGAGFDAVVARDIRFDVWTKLIGNLSFNPIAALTGALMNRICANEGLLDIIRPMLLEGMAVAARHGIEINMAPDARIALARELGSAKISMQQDLEQGRRLELDAIVGAVLELAGRVDVPMPVTRMIDALIRERAHNSGLL